MKAKKDDTRFDWFERLNAIHRLVICLLLGCAAYALLLPTQMQGLIKIMAGWDIFCMGMLTMSWITFFKTPITKIRLESKKQDESRIIIFVINLIATCASMLAVLILLISKNDNDKALALPIAIGGMGLSWFLVHTIFTFRYTHLYYQDNQKAPETHSGGLEFPDEEKPDYMDFAYFSFVIGMTFQVSDVSIHSGKIRKLVLMHSLLSFGFNAVIVALTINVVAGLSK